MKDFFKKITVFLGIIVAISATVSLTAPNSVFAARDLGGQDNSFLGLTNWDYGVTDMHSETDLQNNIVTIASNILTDIAAIASYLVVGYVIWGGYLYMFSSGDPGKAAAGKKTLTHAFIGLAICISAYTIFGAIRIALLGGSGNLGNCTVGSTCVTPETLIANLVQWIAGISGVVCAVFIVVGGWGYMTSAGDPNKLSKAKNTLLYAFIGLAIVALAEVIAAFVANTVADANTSYLPSSVAVIKKGLK